MHPLCLFPHQSDASQAFEWIVKDVQKLKQFIEESSTSDGAEGSEGNASLGDFEVLKESPTIGDGKFKLEIGTLIHFTLDNCLTQILFSEITRPRHVWVDYTNHPNSAAESVAVGDLRHARICTHGLRNLYFHVCRHQMSR